MATQVKHRRGTASEIAAGTPAIGELWFNTTDNTIHMGDGVTQGGIKQSPFANVKNYGAKGDGVTDDTAAFYAAQEAHKHVYVPEGEYALTGLRIKSNRTIIGAGTRATFLKQTNASVPALNVISDAQEGQLVNCVLDEMRVDGHPSATVVAVNLEANGVYAIYRSTFNLDIYNTYQAIKGEDGGAANIFYCDFKLNIVGTQIVSAYLSGVYNRYDFFIAQCANAEALKMTASLSTIERLACEGTIEDSGQGNIYVKPTIENLLSEPASRTAITLTGFNTELQGPRVTLGAGQLAYLDTVIAPFQYSRIISPRYIFTSASQADLDRVDSFKPIGFSWYLEGIGQSPLTKTLEDIYAPEFNDVSICSMSGDLSAFTNEPTRRGERKLQHVSGTTLVVTNTTDILIIDDTNTSAVNLLLGTDVSYKYTRELTIQLSASATNNITTIGWSGVGSDYSGLPSTINIGDVYRILFDKETDAWIVISKSTVI